MARGIKKRAHTVFRIMEKKAKKNPPFAPAGTFFLFALMCIPYLLIMWKLVPETTGKSLEEIERWWTGEVNPPAA